MSILQLDDYVLLLVFEKCGDQELENLCLVCKRFYSVIQDCIYYKKSLDLLITGSRFEFEPNSIYQRTFNKPTYLRRLKVNHNWNNGKYSEEIFFRHNVMYPSFIHLEADGFYMTHGGELRAHHRKKLHSIEKQAYLKIGSTKKPDITCFTKKGDTIFAGRDDGVSFIYDTGDYYEERTSKRSGLGYESINSVDFCRDFFVTASKTSLTYWKKLYELECMYLEPIHDIAVVYKSVKIAPNGEIFCAGIYLDRAHEALELHNIEPNSVKKLGSKTTAVYDIKFIDNNLLLTANYDGSLRVFDLRTNCDEQQWMDPFDASIYTLDYDGSNGLICGVSHHCRVNLYDRRVPAKYVQMYYPSMKDKRHRGSPVYGIAIDANQLFIATDHNLRILDFRADWSGSRDYRNIFANG